MKKVLLGLLALAFLFIGVACGNDNNDPATTDPGIERPLPLPGPEVTVDQLPADIQALIAQWNLPEPRFTPDANVPGWQNDQAHHAELTWYVNYIWWPTHTMGDSWVTYTMMGELNVRINFTSGNTEALNAMLAGGDLPDIITLGGYNVGIVSDAHMFAFPLDVLATVYDPYFLSIFPEQTQNWMRLPDGHFYGIPNESMTSDEINAGFAMPGTGFFVRQDIYEGIGSPDMSTPDGFLQALRDAVEFMPTDDAGRPLVAFSGDMMNIMTNDNGAFSGVIQDFLAIPTVNADGTFFDRDAHPEYLEWLLVFRQAYEEGLITPDQFSDDNETVNNRFETGNFFALMTSNTNDFASRLNNISNNNPDQMMIPVSGPRNSAGDPHTFAAGGINGWTHTFITQNTNDPQTAIQVLTYLYSDHGQMLQQFGVEGETFEFVDGVPTLLPHIQEFLTDDYYGFRDEYGIRTFWMLRRPGFFASQGVLPTGPHGNVQLFNRQFNQARLNFVNLEPTLASNEMLQMNLEVIDLNRSQAIANVLTASTDAEAIQIWENFLASRDNFDWAGITEYRNERLRINNERLGIN